MQKGLSRGSHNRYLGLLSPVVGARGTQDALPVLADSSRSGAG